MVDVSFRRTTAATPIRALLRAGVARLQAMLGTTGGNLPDGSSDLTTARRVAGTAFAIRVGGAAIVYLSQIALARWMGSAEFGLFVFSWTCVLLAGDLVHLGLASAAPRLVPQYGERGDTDRLRGFVHGSARLVFALATLLAACAFGISFALAGGPPGWLVGFACLSLPFYALANMLDGIARSYGWINSALAPPYFIRPLLLVALIAGLHASGATTSAAIAMGAAAAACVVAAAIQFVDVRRRLARVVPAGPRHYAISEWLATALPIFLVWSFYTLLTYADVIVLKLFRPAEDVALYFAATKTLALVAFIYFSVSAAVAHKFAEYHVAGRRDALAEIVARATAWTFWPSLAASAVVLALGRPLLSLFGADFVSAYPLMFISAIGLLARASVGPAERLLNMLGEQRACAAVYATSFAVAATACLVLVPWFGSLGAAAAMASALLCEALLLFIVVKRRTGLHAFVWRPTHASVRGEPHRRTP